VFDTKTLAALFPTCGCQDGSPLATPAFIPFKDTSLEPLYKEALSRWGKDFTFEFPLGFEAYHPRVVAGGAGGAVAHQAAYDAYMTGVVYALLKANMPTSIYHAAKNVISVFGNHLMMNLDPNTSDSPVARAVFHIAFSKLKMKRDDVKQLLLTPEQAAMIENATKQQQGTSTFLLMPDLDFHVSVLEGSAYASINKEATNAIVGFFFPSQGITVDEVQARIQSAVARKEAKNGETAGGATANPESTPLSFKVTDFLAWKAGCQSTALVSEPATKKGRVE
jgi:hypothetical protein